MGWRLRVNFDDGSSETEDDIFDTREDAERASQEWLDSWGEGGDVLGLAGESSCSADIYDFDIWEE